jgi:hypothetical protein
MMTFQPSRKLSNKKLHFACAFLLGVPLLFATACGGGSGSGGGGGSSPTITSVSVSCNPTTIQTGQTSQCSATVSGTGSYSSAVTWSATGGTVTSAGVFTPSASGTATITATSSQDTTKSGSATVTVTVPPTITSVSVSCNPSSIHTNQTSQCSATVSGTGSYSSAVTWSATGGTVTSAGVFTPSASGTATITATSSQDTTKSGSATVAVTVPPTITSVSASCNPSSIQTNQTSQCSATVSGTGSYSSAVTWSATGGTVTSAGVFTPSATGTATITATSSQDTTKSGSATVTVTIAPTIASVSVSCNPASIQTGQTSQCSATVSGTGSYSSAVTWSAVSGTISSAGLYKAPTTVPASGSDTVKATSTQDSTKSGSAVITVTPPNNPVPSISGLAPSSVVAGTNDTAVTISGTGFVNTSSAALDGTALTTTFGSSSSIQATIPASVLSTAQFHLMTVTNPAPGGGTSANVGPWISSGAMTVSRASHTQTLLPSGKVLLTGGGWFSGLQSNISASAELFDPTSRTFVATGSMSTARAFHTATILGSGKVLVAGGSSASVNGSPSLGALATAEVFDPSAGTFSLTGTMVSARVYHTATPLADGTVLIAGGIDSKGNILASAEIYNPATGTFAAAGAMSAPRFGHTAALLSNGEVLIAGGESLQANATVDLATAELYNPATGKFTPTGNLVIGRESAIAVTLNNGTVLVAGGYQYPTGFLQEAEIYDPTKATFTTAGSMGTPRNLHSAALLGDGTVLVVGGGDGSTVLASAEIYSPSTGQFSSTWTMPEARMLTAATTLSNGSVLVSGGEGISGVTDLLASAEVYPAPASSSGTKVAQFVVNNPVPEITSLSATTVPSGTQVTITGDNFVNTAEALLNGLSVPSYGNPSVLTSFWFYPNLAGTYSVAVNNPSPGGGVSNTVTLEVTFNVQISPTQALWAPGSTNQFSATVAGASNTNVNWSVEEGASGGTVDTTGSYTAPSTPGTYHVIATSQADPTQGAIATVVVGPGAGQMIVGPQMTTPRARHTATLLSTGKVLIIGGNNASGGANAANLSTAEIYDPAANSFSVTGSMSIPRYWHTANLLANGEVLVLGGFTDNGAAASSAEVYDPATGLFSSTGSMIDPVRGICTSTTLQNGKVLVVGGIDANGNITASAELFDSSTGTFSATGSMGIPREGHTATLLNNGKVLIAGGASASAELYDPTSGTFSPTGSMTVPRSSATAVLLGNGKVMIMGQYTSNTAGPADIYDPVTGTFTQTSTPPVYPQEDDLSVDLLPNGLALISGGFLGNGTGIGGYANGTQFFDSQSGSFYAGPLSGSRLWGTMTVLLNGNVLIAGGEIHGPSATTDLYTPGAVNPLPAAAMGRELGQTTQRDVSQPSSNQSVFRLTPFEAP